MIETPQGISDWSVEVFPTLTKEAQEAKLVEEILEYIKASDNEKVKELADIYIVASILKHRFGSDLGFAMFRGLFTLDMTPVYKEIDRKMKVNRARVWKWNGKTYHHEEGIGE